MPGRRGLTTEERFLRHAPSGEFGACWEWSGPRNRTGYGTFYAGGGRSGRRQLSAHRFAYERACGAVPAGLCVLHSCDNPPCVNPAHLRVGTHKENSHDAMERRRHVACDRHPAAKLTAEAVQELRSIRGGGRLAHGERRRLAKKYGVAPITLGHARCGVTWRRLDA